MSSKFLSLNQIVYETIFVFVIPFCLKAKVLDAFISLRSDVWNLKEVFQPKRIHLFKKKRTGSCPCLNVQRKNLDCRKAILLLALKIPAKPVIWKISTSRNTTKTVEFACGTRFVKKDMYTMAHSKFITRGKR